MPAATFTVETPEAAVCAYVKSAPSAACVTARFSVIAEKSFLRSVTTTPAAAPPLEPVPTEAPTPSATETCVMSAPFRYSAVMS